MIFRIGWQRCLVFVTGGRVENLSHQLAHRFAFGSQKIVYFGEDESGYDDGSR